MEYHRKYLLDGSIEVIFIKSFIRSLAKCLVKLPGDSIALVEYYRLREIPDPKSMLSAV